MMKVIELSYQKNIRDLGGMTGFNGKKVKYGRIFRGGHLIKVSDEDIKKINSLRLTDLIDFRSAIEYKKRPDYQFMGVTYHNLPSMPFKDNDGLQNDNKYEDSNLLWFLDEGVSGFEHMFNIYPDILLSQEGIAAQKEFFNILLKDNNRVVYYHCSQGKDRAGLSSFILEIALGVSMEDAKEDYLYSNVAMKTKIKQLKAMLRNKPFYNKEYEKSLEEVFMARSEYLDNAIKLVEENCGSLENYIKNILKVDVDKLREIYLE